MAEENWELGQVATQTAVVFISKKDNKQFSLEEALVQVLNQNDKIIELLGK